MADRSLDRREFLLASAAAGLLPTALRADPAPTAKRPNFVFFILDDMHRYQFNCLPEGAGRNYTPAIDRLAAEGTVMLGQHCTAPVCTPSRYCCLTGNHASRALGAQAANGGQTVVTWNTNLAPGAETIGSWLQQAGYRTGFVGKNHCITAPGLRKTAWTDDPAEPAVASRLRANAELVNQAIAACGFDYVDRIYQGNPEELGAQSLGVHNLDWITAGALEFLDGVGDQPFFLYYASTVPHGPVAPDRSWRADRRITPAGILAEPPGVLPPAETIPQRIHANRPGAPPNILYLDDAVAAVMGRLEERGLADNTIVVFFTDHGQAAKGTLYQGGVSCPSIVWRRGGFPCGAATETLVTNTDFAPTLLELAGAAQPADRFDGRSFAPVLVGDPSPIHDSLYFEMGFTRAVRVGDWKYLALRYTPEALALTREQRQEILDRVNANLTRRGRKIHSTDPMAPFSHVSAVPGGGDAEQGSYGKYPGYWDPDQLYHLADDPGEQQNLAGDPAHALRLAELQELLRAHLDRLPGSFAELKPAAG